MNFSSKIISWYSTNKRDLPWRETTDPYFIWLSEIILQQTRVVQGLAYYHKFIENFPTVFDLANASEEEVLSLWQGLGYYSRARNLHKTAKIIAFEKNGIFPSTYKELIKLKGIGDYTASAIASFCFKEHTAVLDGNVFRVLARYFGIDQDISDTKSKKIFAQKALHELPKHHSDLHNQAIMEFGALQCKPVSPQCLECVLKESCFAFTHQLQSSLPVKLKKTKTRTRYFYYLVYYTKDGAFLKKREGKDIWENLYDFKLIEKNTPLKTEEFYKFIRDTSSFVLTLQVENEVFEYKHILSHQELRVIAFPLKVNEQDFIEEMEFKNWEEIEELPKPVLVNKIINDLKNGKQSNFSR